MHADPTHTPVLLNQSTAFYSLLVALPIFWVDQSIAHTLVYFFLMPAVGRVRISLEYSSLLFSG